MKRLRDYIGVVDGPPTEEERRAHRIVFVVAGIGLLTFASTSSFRTAAVATAASAMIVGAGWLFHGRWRDGQE